MSAGAWWIFAGFWALFVTTPGPNAVNCIANGMTFGLPRALWGVLAILTQAALFLTLSALGVAALLVTAPVAFFWAKLMGAAVLIALGVRGWRAAAKPVAPGAAGGRSIYARALLIATVNAKSVAGYLAAFTQFVDPAVPLAAQMWVIAPTALSLTALSYTGFTVLGSWLGRLAMGAILNVRVRQALALCFLIYGALLAASALAG